MRLARVVLGALAACSAPHRGVPAGPLTEGIAISIYSDGERSYGVVDDRRWVTVTSGSIVLDRVEPAASLESLVIEPIAIERCVRERASASPPVLSTLVRCQVRASPGRHLVRVLYVLPPLAFQTRHQLVMTDPTKAVLSTRFSIATPAWSSRGDVYLFAGLPGGDKPVREVSRGRVLLDGTIALLASPPQLLPARLRVVFDGAVDGGVPTTEIAWGSMSHAAVWVWAELERAAELAPGRMQVQLALPDQPRRDLDIATGGSQLRGGRLRLPLYADELLHGSRKREVQSSSPTRIVERLRVSVSNLAEVPREVWIEERLRPAHRRELTRAQPTSVELAGKRLTHRVVIPPRGSSGLDVTIRYDL